MLDYTQLKDKGGLEPWPPLRELPFVKVLEGDPMHTGRFDLGGFGKRTMTGVWQCTPGRFEYTYPGDEFCTLLAGRIEVVDEDGKTHRYGAGDSFYMRKGEVGVWHVIETIRKIFNIHDPDSSDLSH